MARIGVLALQGGYKAHEEVLKSLGHDPVEVRDQKDLYSIDGLILPGGETTTHLKLINRWNLWSPLNEFFLSSKPVLATCAGIILCAKKVLNPKQQSFQCLDITVERNSYGSQINSFEAISDNNKYPLIFIRAPKILQVSDKVQILDTLKGDPILVKQNNIIGATFHPELTSCMEIHQIAFHF